MNILEDLNWRYATKEFDAARPVSPEDLETLWKFVVVENKELKDQLLPHSWHQKQVVQAGHVIVLCRPKTFGADDVAHFIKSTATARSQDPETLSGYQEMMSGFLARMNEDQVADWMKNQIYIALGSFIAPEYDKVLGLSEKGLTSVVVCPVGYRAASDKYGELAKVRYAKEDLVVRM
jgi:nitroreductase